MRFSRFKQQMEGIPTQTRKPRASAANPKKEKQKKDKISEPNKVGDDDTPTGVKSEPTDGVEPMNGVQPTMTGPPPIKPEPMEESFGGLPDAGAALGAEWTRRISLEPKAEPETPCFAAIEKTAAPSQAAPAIKDEPPVKLEPEVKVEPRWDE